MLAKTPWPDWVGEAVAIIASGPSLKGENLELLRGRLKVIAIKQSYDRCTFADAVYGCDDAWWRFRRGLPEFKGLKFAWGAKACAEFSDLRKVVIKEKVKRSPRDDVAYVDEIQSGPIGVVGAGGNSGFQALNLAVQFGVTRALLVGFDMHDRGGVHWYGRNNWTKANNPDETNFQRWRAAFAAAAPVLAGMGIDVLNASAISDLMSFPRMSIADALRRWGL